MKYLNTHHSLWTKSLMLTTLFFFFSCSSDDDNMQDPCADVTCDVGQQCEDGDCITNPDFIERFEAVGNTPALPYGDDWDSGHNFGLSVVAVNDTLKMWYMGGKWGFPFQESRIGYRYSTDNGETWIRHPEPVLSPESQQDVMHPVVIYEDGLYHMWHGEGSMINDFNTNYYATSSDGINWTRQGTVSGIGNQNIIWSVIREEGKYRVWFFRLDGSPSGSDPDVSSEMYYAESTDGLNMTVRSEPILVPTIGSYDHQWAWFPSVIKISDSEYHMYYGANRSVNSCPDQTIALATSTDGITWQKEGVVFIGRHPWALEVAIPRVIVHNNKFKLWYSGFPCPGDSPITGYAEKDL